ncbi:MAG: ubiquinol-cytochrome c reductase iron-sulfur subunit [Kangiellaceae bacterium]|jgi:ubiquinol-cytochrome c reductase iron-sulfur subunit
MNDNLKLSKSRLKGLFKPPGEQLMSEVSADSNKSAKNDHSNASAVDLTSENTSRRKFLTIATSVIGAIGVAGASIPFIASWQPSARAKAAGADVEVDISGIQVGQLIRVMWRSKPVWIVRRTPELLASLAAIEDQLSDPASEEEQQPVYAQNQYRSIKSEYLVLVGICTHLGCSPQHLVEGAFNQHAEGIAEGFFCPCHGSKFDMAGRVFSGVPAPSNLVVPPYMYIDDNTILLGSDEGVV